MRFNIEISQDDGGLFLASALGFIGGGNTVREALDAWVDAIVDDVICRTHEATHDS